MVPGGDREGSEQKPGLPTFLHTEAILPFSQQSAVDTREDKRGDEREREESFFFRFEWSTLQEEDEEERASS